MTLLLALSNESYAVVLGDRRLVSDGVVRDDEANKLCVLFCDDARVVIAFTGFAGVGSFRTQDWLRDTLYEIGKSKHQLDKILADLQESASRRFAKLPASIRAIAFLISGFRYSGQPENVCYFLGNYRSDTAMAMTDDEFHLRPLGAFGSTIVEAEGFKSVLTDRDYSSLRKMLEAGNSAPTVLRKAVEIVQRVSKDSKSRRFIGAQCNSGVVPRLPDTNVVNTYHSASAVIRAYGPDIVFAVTDCGGAVTGMFLQTDTILAGPEIRKNDHCWCGSGKKFKMCHLKKFGSVYARLPGFRKPLHMVVAFWKKTPELSGRQFVVTGSFV